MLRARRYVSLVSRASRIFRVYLHTRKIREAWSVPIIFYHCLMIVPDQAHGNGILFIAEHSITFSWVKLLNQEHMLCLVLSLIVVDV